MNPFTFHFIHANIFHLLANLYALYCIHKAIKWNNIIPAYVICSLTWYAIGAPNVGGLSAIIYYIIGTYFPNAVRVQHTTKKKIALLALMAFSLLITLAIPNVSFALHAIPFACGCTQNFITSYYQRKCRYKR